IRDAPHADPAVVIWYVLDQPVDRVIGVRAFVDVVGAVLLRPVRPHVDELALRHPAPADVLVDDDVTLVAEERRGTEVRLVRILATPALASWSVGGSSPADYPPSRVRCEREQHSRLEPKGGQEWPLASSEPASSAAASEAVGP